MEALCEDAVGSRVAKVSYMDMSLPMATKVKVCVFSIHRITHKIVWNHVSFC